ncbi:phytochrome-like protein cph1 [Arenibacter sp. NBRC 103722]|uniref:sensor histidine kinase n=1 Tax=Arenibacter sp. NBRC 103722 TaxID=1113929 RepID=UPI000853C71C|nr:GAF domain-containing sensor histidine kinase [Arenibacter sp. NBRC 103722]MDX1767959.1 GAF domain-containing sensor histidine kinase [Arenibacter troitsensis]GBF22507.1 phytochrome-like protein cph1 [Arenibacter sp. NBRC 103722]
MIPPKHHFREKERLEALYSYSILDTLPEEDYDNLTNIAAEICGTPISLVTLVDKNRQWFKSRHGIQTSETPRKFAFCAHAINTDDGIFIVQDSRLDNRFNDNPLVDEYPRVIFYAGIPLVSDEGLPLGTLCVIDHKPRALNHNQVQALKSLSNQVMNLLKLRRTNAQLKMTIEMLNDRNQNLEQFAQIAAHDLKSPLNNISSISELFLDNYNNSLDVDGRTMISLIQNASEKLRGLIDGLLEYSKSEAILTQKTTNVDLEILSEDIRGLLSFDNSITFVLNSELKSITINRTAIHQILINLVTNAIKYHDKHQIKIEFGVREDEVSYEFYVMDNGPGIAKENQVKVFQLFQTLGANDRFNREGNGIGLATVKNIVNKMGGSIRIESDPPNGCKFVFSVKKNINAAQEIEMIQ